MEKAAAVLMGCFPSFCSSHWRRMSAVSWSAWKMLTGLQRSDVRDDGPAVARRNLAAIGGHRAKSLADDGVQMPDRRIAQAVHMIGGGPRVPALHDLAVPGAQGIVAHDAVNHEAVIAVLDDRAIDRKRKRVHYVDILANEHALARHVARGADIAVGTAHARLG